MSASATDRQPEAAASELRPLSVSQLKSFERCAYAWWLERHQKAWQRPAAWLPQGSAVHTVAECIELAKLAGTPLTLAEAQDVFREEYAKEVGQYTEITPNFDWWFASGPYRGAVDVERRYEVGLEQVEKLMLWTDNHPDEVIWIAPDGTPGIELGFDIELDGLRVRGFIDAIILVDGQLMVRDYKGLSLDTELATPTGWTTMGEVQVGDGVFTDNGAVCRVTAKSAVKKIGTYVVRFDDGAEIVCDSEHIWWTQRSGEVISAKGIEEVSATLRDRRGQAHHRVPVAGPLDLPEVDLALNPYVLGCWLGDGKHSSGEITKDEELFNQIKAEGFGLGKPYVDKRSGCISRTVLGITGKLAELGVRRNKHIPSQYLRSSYKQRLSLLQGLMDTDGCWNIGRKTAVFTTTDRGLAESVTELLHSLGQRPCFKSMVAHGFGKYVDAYHVEFNPVDIVPFRHDRKLTSMYATGTKNNIKSTRRLIVSVEPGPDVETACIAVDAPNRTYLCGREMIPTHNTGNTPGDDFQLGVYAVAVAEMFGIDPPKTGDYYMAGKKGNPGKPTHPYDLSGWTRDRVVEAFRELDENIRAERFEPKPEPSKCRFCSVQLACEFSLA